MWDFVENQSGWLTETENNLFYIEESGGYCKEYLFDKHLEPEWGQLNTHTGFLTINSNNCPFLSKIKINQF